MRQTKLDCVSEVYEGCAGSPQMQAETKARIDWICSKVDGQRVLDVGCSQGITDLLLAREGKHILALDMEPGSIEYAIDRLAGEPESVRGCVEYVCADFLTYDFESQSFDFILISEVLEHLEQPALFLEKAAALLRPEGQILVAVPFGINAHPDHRRTYYFRELFLLMQEFFCVQNADFLLGWMSITAMPKAPGRISPLALDDALLARIEEAFYRVDHRKQASIDNYKNRTTQLEDTISAQKDRFAKREATLRDKIQYLTAANATLKIRAAKYDQLIATPLGRLAVMGLSVRKKVSHTLESMKSRLRPIIHTNPLLFKCYVRYKERHGAQSTEYGRALPASSYLPQEVFEAQSDKDFFSKIEPLLANIPESNGQRYFAPAPTTIGIIADEFLWDSIRAAADFRYLTPDNWQEALPDCQILLLVSAWRGLHQEWIGLSKPGSETQDIAFNIIDACKMRNIPVIFYSKEDPPNYDCFLPLAMQSDYIFTSCAEVMDQYRKDCGTAKVHSLCFSINPLFHNPIGSRGAHKRPGVLFAGSWMAKYPERLKELRILFDGVLEAGLPLKIFDRNYALANPSYRFDKKYWPFISPSVDHASLQKIHKLYDWAININSVKYSATMFANRGFELQAAGVQMISNYSLGVNQRLPNVFIGMSAQEVGRILTQYTPEEVYEHQMMGVRSVMTGETCFDRIAQLLDAVGIAYTPAVRRVLVIADKDTPRIRAMFTRQTVQEKTLAFAAQVTPAQMTEYDIIAFFADDMEYEMFYLEDLCNGFKYTASSYITKSAYYDGSLLHEGVEHDYVNCMECKYRTVFWRADYQPEELLSIAGACDLPGGYSIDHLNYNATPLFMPDRAADYALSLIVPVFNNGRHLYGKAFSSLRRSSLFDKMQILLIDSGSTDGYTPDLLQWLAQRYPNVECFPLGDSDSASHACNKGLKMAAAPYVGYLNPEEEAVHDGLAKLYTQIQRNGCEIALGCALHLSDAESLLDYTTACFKDEQSDETPLEHTTEKKKSDPRVRVQCMLIDKRLVPLDYGEQGGNTTDQSALFSRALYMRTKNVRVISDVVHVFYDLATGIVAS